jgi:IS605 OrfB family transposase
LNRFLCLDNVGHHIVAIVTVFSARLHGLRSHKNLIRAAALGKDISDDQGTQDQLHPTPEQATYFAKAAGTSRFVWNWALAEWDRQYEAVLKPTALKLKKQFNEIRREQFPWTWQVTKNASDQVEMPDALPEKKPTAVGMDVGLNRLATLSTGEGVENQAFLKTALNKLRRANKRLHRRILRSKNREKACRQVARLHYRIACLRDDALHKLTTQLAACYGIIGVEDLNLKGLLKNRKLARSFSDVALGKLVSLLTSKMERRGGQVVKVGRFFPSSKTCHCCGWKWEDMQLSDRVFLCQNPDCAYDQVAQDRDHNAALGILSEALRLIGLLDQAVCGTGSDEDVNLAVDAG